MTASASTVTSDVWQRARDLDPLTLSATAIRQLTRELRRSSFIPEVRLAFAGNAVFDPLAEFAEAHLACSGISSASYVAAFDQAQQEILDDRSALHEFKPSFLFLHLDLEALIATSHAAIGSGDLNLALDHALDIVHSALERTSAIVLPTNFVEPDRYELGIADFRAEPGEQELYARLNASLARTFRNEPRVQVVDLCRLTALHGRTRVRDRRLYYLARLPWRESFLALLADEIVRHVHAGLGRARKCLVVDLDNTLWDGVLGEDGPMGVRIGKDDPVGEAHFDLQRRIAALKRRGILLAVCSKNDPADVHELFRLRPEMPLHAEDFACMRIGWGMKHEGLLEIAADLNIGTDSLAFLDDNPAEIELVRQALPEVQGILVPADPALRANCLDRVHGLERAFLTTEDLARTRQYRENVQRVATRREFAGVADYLRSLQTRVTIRAATAELLPRAHQLYTKTNQFNVTTRRYTLAELQAFVLDPSAHLLLIRAEDRFGDLGWIGSLLLTGLNDERGNIDSFVLSCRAMGRGIETCVLARAVTLCLRQPHCRCVTAEYLPTAKNAAVRELFEGHGFALLEVTAEGRKLYRLDDPATLIECSWIDVLE